MVLARTLRVDADGAVTGTDTREVNPVATRRAVLAALAGRGSATIREVAELAARLVVYFPLRSGEVPDRPDVLELWSHREPWTAVTVDGEVVADYRTAGPYMARGGATWRASRLGETPPSGFRRVAELSRAERAELALTVEELALKRAAELRSRLEIQGVGVDEALARARSLYREEVKA